MQPESDDGFKRWIMAGGGNISDMGRAEDNAVYNSRIAGMLNRSFSQLISLLPLVLILLISSSSRVYAQNWATAEEQLARKIVSAIGTKIIAVEVSNRSSISRSNADAIRRGLLTELATLGMRFANTEQAGAVVHISLSENTQSYVWVAEIRQAANEPSVLMISLPRSEAQSVDGEASAMVLHKMLVWSQQERILDLAVIEGNPAHMLVLDSNGIGFYRQQNSRWQQEYVLPITHARPWPRDLRGKLVLQKDHLFDAYLPGVLCQSSTGAPPAMSCNDKDEPWPIGTEPFSLNASFASSRNFFTGAFSPGAGKQTLAPAFYSAGSFPQDKRTLWLFAGVDGQVHRLDGTTDQALGKLGWGSDVASVRSGCGSGWQILAGHDGQAPSDTVRAYEVPGSEPMVVGTELELTGSITAMWAGSGGNGAIAIVRNSDLGRYEAFRLTLTCNR